MKKSGNTVWVTRILCIILAGLMLLGMITSILFYLLH